MRNVCRYLVCLLVVTGAAIPVSAQTADAAGTSEPAFVTGVLAEREIKLYDAAYVVLETKSVRDFEKLFVDIPPGAVESNKGLPIKALNKAYGLLQLTIADSAGTRDVWVTRNSVVMWPKPDVCQNSVRGNASVTQNSLTVGAGGCR